MLMQEMRSCLRDVRLFRSLTDSEFEEILAAGVERDYHEGDAIYEAGQEERALYFLVEGSAEVEVNVPKLGQKVLAKLAPGSVFGESSFFHANPHTATVKCVTDAHVVRLDRSVFDALLRKDGLGARKLGMNAAEILAERLQHTDHWIVEQLAQIEDKRIVEAWRQLRSRMAPFVTPVRGFRSTTPGWD